MPELMHITESIKMSVFSWLFFVVYFYLFTLMYAFCIMCMQCPERPKEGTESPGTGIAGSFFFF